MKRPDVVLWNGVYNFFSSGFICDRFAWGPKTIESKTSFIYGVYMCVLELVCICKWDPEPFHSFSKSPSVAPVSSDEAPALPFCAVVAPSTKMLPRKKYLSSTRQPPPRVFSGLEVLGATRTLLLTLSRAPESSLFFGAISQRCSWGPKLGRSGDWTGPPVRKGPEQKEIAPSDVGRLGRSSRSGGPPPSTLGPLFTSGGQGSFVM